MADKDTSSAEPEHRRRANLNRIDEPDRVRASQLDDYIQRQIERSKLPTTMGSERHRLAVKRKRMLDN